LNYEGGCNPVNVCYVTGLGWKRQREIVHQYAMNDRRVLPPSGIPLGALQAGFGWLDPYKRELGALSFPLDGAQDAPYPLYDRWGDSFNLQTEFVIVNQARGLAAAAFLMAQTPLKNQRWRAAPAQIAMRIESGETQDARSTAQHPTHTARLTVSGLDPLPARVVWEAQDQEPVIGSTFRFAPTNDSPQWIEAEAQWPDGRRAFAVTNLAPAAHPLPKPRKTL